MVEYSEYFEQGGGKWFYTQNKPGTKWFDNVNNSKGWTVDFNMRLLSAENSIDRLSNTEVPYGAGVYVNDGVRQEVIYFLPQEINFTNAQQSAVFDTTDTVDYRIVGKGSNLSLYGKLSDSSSYSLIKDVIMDNGSTLEGNGLKPTVAFDSQGNLHSVWYDDGNSVGRIYYSKLVNEEWTLPKVIVDSSYGVLNPNIIIDEDNNIYVSFERKEVDISDIGFVYKDNDIGWSEVIFVNSDEGSSKNPSMTIDSQNNVLMVWEDKKLESSEIFYAKWNRVNLKWSEEKLLTNGPLNSYRPSITSYMDKIYVSWTEEQVDNTSIIKAISYSSFTGELSEEAIVSDNSHQADYSDILANVKGDIFIAWHGNIDDNFNVHTRILNPFLENITSIQQVSNGNGGAKFPKLSEESETGDVYYIWEDLVSPFDGSDLDPIDPYVGDSFPSFGRTTIFIAYYDIINEVFSDDYFLTFSDERFVSFPSVPVFFSNNDLPIIYQSLSRDDDNYLTTGQLFSGIRQSSFDLSLVDSGLSLLSDGILINGINKRKEIRFGDFSQTLSVEVVFGKFDFYTDGAVKPLNIFEVSKNTTGINDIIVSDAVVSNYGDAWIVGPNGLMFYYKSNNSVYIVNDDENSAIQFPTADALMRTIAFDRDNNLFVGSDIGIYYSINHFDGFTLLDNTSGYDVSAISFDKNNKIIIGTTNDGVKIAEYEEIDTDGVLSLVLDTLSIVELNSTLPSLAINAIEVDDNNVIWIGTDNGLVRYLSGNILTFNSMHGLPSNYINDIAIENTAVRYIATTNGIARMTGTAFGILSSQDDTIVNNNVKSVAWKDPNILFAGTLSTLNQIIINKEEETSLNVPFEQNEYSSFSESLDELNVFNILLEEDNIIEEDAYVEVFLNGNLIKHGYEVAPSPDNFIKFESKLKPDDVVDVTIRNDVKILTSFEQGDKERASLTGNVIRVAELEVKDDKIYVVVEGDTNQIKLSDDFIKTALPFGKVHFDQTPPTGKIDIIEQIDSSTVRVRISEVDDGEKGSGVDSMVVSNFANFTTNGTNPEDSQVLQSEVNHSLGFTAGNVTSEQEFTQGRGTVVQYLNDNNELYSATSKPSVLYQYISSTESWKSVAAFETDSYIDFIVEYNNKLIVSVGYDTQVAQLHVFSRNNGVVDFEDKSILSLEESRAFSFRILNNILYIGTGIGDGDEYQEGIGEGGRIYSYDGQVVDIIVESLDLNINGLTDVNDRLIAVSGTDGLIYEVNPIEKTAIIIHNDSDALSSIDSIVLNNKERIFMGSSNDARILRSNTDNYSFFVSFRLSPEEVKNIETFDVIKGAETTQIMYASIGNILYFLSDGVWTWNYTHTEFIEDIAFNSNTQEVYVVSSAGVTKITPLTQEKTVYLQLIDRAGNISILGDVSSTDAIDDNPLADSISITDLNDFINENQILELDENGDIVFTLSGTNNFYSADRVQQEKGEYVSEIFDGTNDIIKWDTFSWQATEPTNTEVLTYIRSSGSSTDILEEEWIGPFSLDQSGVDISYLNGQFIQFKVDLISTEKDISPLFQRASIRVVIGESVHFFTTNFVLPGKITKGILTSEKLLPVSSDVVFALNTTNSVDFTDYQIIEENRLFNMNLQGENLRVGIKFITPTRSLLDPVEFDEYGPYNSELEVNTIDFGFINDTSETNNYFFRVTLYEDASLTLPIFSASTDETQEGFNINNAVASSSGIELEPSDVAVVLYSIPGSANIRCNTFYFSKIETFYKDEEIENTTLISDDTTFIASCTANFVDLVEFDFTNNSASNKDYHFRIRFYEDPERTNIFTTAYSGNNKEGWVANDSEIPDDGVTINSGNSANVLYTPDLEDFETQTTYYLIIDAWDGADFVFASNSYTFQARDITSLVYCGEYSDVPIVKNFGLMFELDNNEHVNLNSIINPIIDIS